MVSLPLTIPPCRSTGQALVDHSGKLIEDVGWLWDHAQQRHVIAHDYVISNYVCPSGSHYPIEWRRFRKKDACAAKDFKSLS